MGLIKAQVIVGFDVLGIPSSLDMFIEGGEHISVSHDVPGNPKVTIQIEAESECYLKDVWGEGLIEMLLINVNDDELARINDARDAFCVARM